MLERRMTDVERRQKENPNKLKIRCSIIIKEYNSHRFAVINEIWRISRGKKGFPEIDEETLRNFVYFRKPYG